MVARGVFSEVINRRGVAGVVRLERKGAGKSSRTWSEASPPPAREAALEAGSCRGGRKPGRLLRCAGEQPCWGQRRASGNEAAPGTRCLARVHWPLSSSWTPRWAGSLGRSWGRLPKRGVRLPRVGCACLLPPVMPGLEDFRRPPVRFPHSSSARSQPFQLRDPSWDQVLPREAVESPSLEIFQTRLDKVLYSLM